MTGAHHPSPGARSLRGLAMVLLVASAAAAVAYRAGRASARGCSELADELREQRAALADISDALARRPTSPPLASTRCPVVPEAGSSLVALEEAVDRSVQKGLGRSAQAAELAREAKTEPTVANLEAFARGEQLLEGALGAKTWTSEQALRLRGVLGGVTGAQAAELLRRLSAAINAGRLAVKTAGSLI